MSITLRAKNWDSFQHYKTRNPAWVKLYRGLLDDYEFACLPVASRALAPMMWLLASEYPNGEIQTNIRKLSFRLHMGQQELIEALKPLIKEGFFELLEDASGVLAECYQDACLEKRREETYKPEKEGEEKAAPLKPVFVTSKDSPGRFASRASDTTPDDLHELQYATRLFEDLGLAVLPSELQVAAASILALSRQPPGMSKGKAFESIRAPALAAQQRGETINRFWFTDRKWSGANGQQKQTRQRQAFDAIDRAFDGSPSGTSGHEETGSAEVLPGGR